MLRPTSLPTHRQSKCTSTDRFLNNDTGGYARRATIIATFMARHLEKVILVYGMLANSLSVNGESQEVTSDFLTALECTKVVFGRSSAPDPAVNLQRFPGPLYGLKGFTSKGEERRGNGGREGERKGRKGMGRDSPYGNSWIRACVCVFSTWSVAAAGQHIRIFLLQPISLSCCHPPLHATKMSYHHIVPQPSKSCSRHRRWREKRSAPSSYAHPH